MPTDNRIRRLAMLAAVACSAAVLAACGIDEDDLHVEEGQSLHLGDLVYSVELTRFLNPAEIEDAAYLEGQKPPPNDSDYLAVFMQVENEGESAEGLPSDLTVHDARGNVYRPLETDSLFALELGTEIPGHTQLPLADSPAASGPIQGAFVLFLVDAGISENRPLELEIPADVGKPGIVELDI